METPPPVTDRVQAGLMLAQALEGLPLGRADRAFLASAECHWPPVQVALLASLLWRARTMGRSQ
jgi:hypothetical protein